MFLSYSSDRSFHSVPLSGTSFNAVTYYRSRQRQSHTSYEHSATADQDCMQSACRRLSRKSAIMAMSTVARRNPTFDSHCADDSVRNSDTITGTFCQAHSCHTSGRTSLPNAHMPIAGTKLYCFVTDTYNCEQHV